MQLTGVYRRFAVINFTFADFANAVFVPALVLPNGSEVLSGELVITTASNAAGTDTIEFGIASNSNRNLAATDAKTVASTAFGALTNVSGETLGITRRVSAGAGTVGAGYLRVEYLIPFGTDFVVGALPIAKDANGST